MERKQKAEVLATRINSILPLIDMFANTLSSEDIDMLKETQQAMLDKIRTNNAAMAVIMACGGKYDDTEDRFKISTLECLIRLCETRRAYGNYMAKKEETEKMERDILDMFGVD